MNETLNDKIYERIYRIAQFQAQISIATLPIGAGAAALIAQKEFSLPLLITLVMVWAGLLGISISVVLNLKLIKTYTPLTSNQDADLLRLSNAAMITFIAGIMLLISAPLGYAANQIYPASSPEMSISSRAIAVTRTKVGPVQRIVILSIQNINPEEINRLRLNVATSDRRCVTSQMLNEVFPTSRRDAWITSWAINIASTCPTGDQLVVFNLLSKGRIVGQTSFIVTVDLE